MKVTLVVTAKDILHEVILEGGPCFSIGRADSNLVLVDPRCSKFHALLFENGKQLAIRDMGSTNGTWVNAKKVGEGPLKVGDNIQIGDTMFLVKDYQPSENSVTGATREGMVVLHSFQDQYRALSEDQLKSFIDHIDAERRQKSDRLTRLNQSKVKKAR